MSSVTGWILAYVALTVLCTWLVFSDGWRSHAGRIIAVLICYLLFAVKLLVVVVCLTTGSTVADGWWEEDDPEDTWTMSAVVGLIWGVVSLVSLVGVVGPVVSPKNALLPGEYSRPHVLNLR
jgi:hypothetical protein